MTQFSTVARPLRLTREISLATLATALDTTPAHVSAIERGVELVDSLSMALRWCAVLGGAPLTFRRAARHDLMRGYHYCASLQPALIRFRTGDEDTRLVFEIALVPPGTRDAFPSQRAAIEEITAMNTLISPLVPDMGGIYAR